MVFDAFRLRTSVRVVALTVTVAAECLLLESSGMYATKVLLAGAIVGQVVALIHALEKTNRSLARFLENVRYGDFTSTHPGGTGGESWEELQKAFASVMEEFRNARAQTEEHYQSLQTVIQHIGVGLVSFDTSGEIGIFNAAAKRLLRTHQVPHLRSLAAAGQELVTAMQQMKSGDKRLVSLERDQETLQLAMYATEYRVHDRHFTLVSLQNIGSELEEKEMEAWQNLIRVLTHEIMNSITPISSLASTVHGLLVADEHGAALTPETIDDIRKAAATIEKRSQGLLHFVDSYRTLTHIQRPAFALIKVADLTARITQLMAPQVSEQAVQWTVHVEPADMEIAADPGLIEQVLINLVRNALQAMKGRPGSTLDLLARHDADGHVVMDIVDNGPGIPRDNLQRVFIPFFTTREAGSGIGLSLSRQIMRLHGGTLACRSRDGEGATFTMRF